MHSKIKLTKMVFNINSIKYIKFLKTSWNNICQRIYNELKRVYIFFYILKLMINRKLLKSK